MNSFIIDLEDDAAFARWHEVYAAAHLNDHPANPFAARSHFLGFARSRQESHEHRYWALANGDEWVAVAEDVRPLKENTEVVLAEIAVSPDHRQAGHGKRLFETIKSHASQAGRSRWIGELPQMPGDPESGQRFAESLGFRLVLTTYRRCLEPPIDRTGEWFDEVTAMSSAYQITAWSGPTPAWALAGKAALARRVTLDSPMGEMDYEPEEYTPDRIQEDDRMIEAMGMQAWGAVAALDGDVVAYTHISADTEANMPAYQWDTIVAPEQRGNRLGLAVKVANHRNLATGGPPITGIWTNNAVDNDPMAKVNEILGFEIRGKMAEYQLDW